MWEFDREKQCKYCIHYKSKPCLYEKFNNDNYCYNYSDYTIKCGVTPEKVYTLKPNQIFVFGANLLGIHKRGSAKDALDKFGAVLGKIGLQGDSYGLPTKNKPYEFMPYDDLLPHVFTLYETIISNSDKYFVITKVGCNLAGFTIQQMANLFTDFVYLENCSLPQEFIDFAIKKLNKENENGRNK